MEYLPEVFSTARSPMFSTPFRALEEFFDTAFKPWVPSSRFAVPSIPLDVTELPEKYIVKADLPGIERKFVDISFENQMLTLKVELTKEEEKKETRYLLRERLFSSTARSVPLPLADSKATIDAHLKEGVLTVVIPKQLEKQMKRIEIH